MHCFLFEFQQKVLINFFQQSGTFLKKYKFKNRLRNIINTVSGSIFNNGVKLILLTQFDKVEYFFILILKIKFNLL